MNNMFPGDALAVIGVFLLGASAGALVMYIRCRALPELAKKLAYRADQLDTTAEY